MSDTELKTLFEAYPGPVPTADLADRIEYSLPQRPAANDNRHRATWIAGLSAVAAVALFAVFAVAPMSEPDDDWAAYADNVGFSDLHAWVEGES